MRGEEEKTVGKWQKVARKSPAICVALTYYYVSKLVRGQNPASGALFLLFRPTTCKCRLLNFLTGLRDRVVVRAECAKFLTAPSVNRKAQLSSELL